MKDKKLQTKDLIMAGVFAVLYVALICILASLTGMLIPVYLVLPLIAGVILGPVYTLYLSKVPKMGAVLILSVLAGFVMSASSIMVLVYVVALGIIAQVILSKTNYSEQGIRWSYIVFACATEGPFLSLFFAREGFLNTCVQYYGQEYADKIDAATPMWFLLVQIGLALIGGYIGGRIGVAMNAKHFKKAGIA
ncbi:MAG: MptD family putative ECF transporter S component [Lachnospiraceae bacterium]|nr:MptD family putative ECF transporter S component [Lachnospiraceae bacterium]